MTNNKKKRKLSLAVIFTAGLLLIMIIGILPGYVRGGSWQWQEEKRPANASQLNRLRQNGIALEGWDIAEQSSVRLSDKTWSWQRMTQEGRMVTLLIHSQPHYVNKPSVEWTDLQNVNVNATICLSQISELLTVSPQEVAIDSSQETIGDVISDPNVTREQLTQIVESLPGFCSNMFNVVAQEGRMIIDPSAEPRDWSTDSRQIIDFKTDEDNSIKAIFERGWNNRQTVAIVNWYGWVSGGDYRPHQWFINDLKAQLRGTRVGWFAVSLRLHINALEEIEPFEEELQQIAGEVQRAIVEQIR